MLVLGVHRGLTRGGGAIIINVEHRVTSMEGRLTGVDTKVTSMDGRLTGVEAKVTSMDENVMAIMRHLGI